MKKTLIFNILLIIICYATTQAQELGLRFGDVTGGNVALDGVFSTSQLSRIHADVSFGDKGIGADVLWDFVYKPLGDLGFNWYAGVGPAVFLADPLSLFAVGELGAEYTIKEFPVSLSLDWRPTLRIIQTTDLIFNRVGFNVRYVFQSKSSDP